MEPVNETPALIIIDMVKDTFDESKKFPIARLADRTFDPINSLIAGFRTKGWPVVFSTDAFHADDFIFTGRMKPHSLAGSEGAEVIDALDFRKEDHWLPKPKFSAFFSTGLEIWLRKKGVSLCAVAGISTHICVLTTAMDAISHDFKAVILEDCTAAVSDVIHENILSSYRRNPLYPLFRVLTARALADELGIKQPSF